MPSHNRTPQTVLDAPRPDPLNVYEQTGAPRRMRRRRHGVPNLPAVNVPFRGKVSRDLVPVAFAERDKRRGEAARRLAALLRGDKP